MKDYILVVGGCGWDCTHKQNADLTYNSTPDSEFAGSKGSNQAVAISRAGYDTKIISIVGNDIYGHKIIESLKTNKIDTSLVKIMDGIKSDCSHIYVDLEGGNEIVRQKDAIKQFSTDIIFDNQDVIRNARCVVFQSKLPRDVYVELINLCYTFGVATVFTPCPSKDLVVTNDENLKLLQKVTYITANRSESLEISATNNLEDALKVLPNLIATAGGDGVFFVDEQGNSTHLPAMKPQVLRDTTGAGDTFCGNFIVSILKGYSKTDAVKRGIKASTLKLNYYGAQAGMPYEKDLENNL